MLQAFFGEVKGVFGKAYVLAGLLPSALLLVCLKCYFAGLAGVRVEIAALLKAKDVLASDGVFDVIQWLILALPFFAGRRFVLETFQALPWSGFGPLRKALVRRQLERRRQAAAAHDEALFDITALTWDLRKYALPEYYPPWLKLPKTEAVLEESAWARSAISDAAADRAARRAENLDVPRATAALRNLYGRVAAVAEEAGFCDDRALMEEGAAWEAASQNPDVASILRMLEGEARTRWLEARRHRERFPSDETWIAPTSFGNRLAALDDYADKRYKSDTTTLWSRLQGILPAAERNEISDVRLSVEVLLNLTVAAMAAGLVVLGHTLWESVSVLLDSGLGIFSALLHGKILLNWRAIVFLAGAGVFARITYFSAVYSVSSMAEIVVRLVDLYRLKLLVALGYECPKTVGDEVALLEELHGFFVQATPRDPARALKLESPKGKDEESADKGKPSDEGESSDAAKPKDDESDADPE